MIKLVAVFLPKNRSLKRTWSSYEEKLKDYFINSGGLLKDADAVQFGVKGVPPGTRVMIAKVDRDDYTLDDIFFFRRAIPKDLDIPEYDLYFSFVHIGSLCLGYLIPEYLYSLLFPLTAKLQQQLASIGITELTCGDDNYYLTKFYIEEVQHSFTDIDKDGNNVCHYSLSEGHTHFIKHLVENYQLDLCAVNDEGMAPIHLACSEGKLNLIQYIIEHIPSSLELPDSQHGRTPFLTAVYFNHFEIIKYLISKKCNISATDDEGSEAVHISVARDHSNILKYLMDNNYCNPNATDYQDRTPLHVAVTDYEYEILEYLLSKSIPSMSVVWLPCQHGRQNMVSLLLKASLSNNNLLITNKKGQTPLHLAVASGHKDTAEELLFSVTGSSTHHDLLTATDNEGSTVFHTACRIGHIDVFCYLSSIVSNLVPKDKSGRTPLHYASRSDNIHIVRYHIETFPCTPDDPDNNGYTSVHAACEAGSMELVQYFLTDLKCNALAETDDCKTMLYFASKSSNLDLVRFLVKAFSLKPCPHDIEIAQSVNPDSSVVKYLQEIHYDLFLLEQSKVSGYYEKLEGQQVDPPGQDIVS
ncbi:PREDICTED: uncharacterized protein LOC105314076 [Amphimedon queenslandica]|uniref:Uncharacterized protein n=1 Tax=Amphimedon queenslandica TaxID=400682 RepID=A0AAN0IPD7_AMPQE|nr:PREDICTED: uncharacterized protein LOC105314076 [Amphimedon queenslandica]|eukprot:XP_011406303.1 PREDICTED: uncharacterized protein LOC105314076 [Amphimedon queenslandica]